MDGRRSTLSVVHAGSCSVVSLHEGRVPFAAPFRASPVHALRLPVFISSLRHPRFRASKSPLPPFYPHALASLNDDSLPRSPIRPEGTIMTRSHTCYLAFKVLLSGFVGKRAIHSRCSMSLPGFGGGMLASLPMMPGIDYDRIPLEIAGAPLEIYPKRLPSEVQFCQPTTWCFRATHASSCAPTAQMVRMGAYLR